MIRLRVKELAEPRGFNISSLSRKADLGFSTVKRIWNDPYHDAAISTLDKLSQALKLPIQDLFEQIPDEKE
ncbi:MAG TPA: helix-turn-helix transcriptional regulator [Ktedonosporobacter sp.]|nr:helix-turn-helix transcriptional regulator [Ktedonosporobacter sp.]